MRLQSVIAKNYRSLENINIEFTSNYCTISGANDAGKSSILRLIQYLFEPSNNIFETTQITYEEDATQWSTKKEPIVVTYLLTFFKDEDRTIYSTLIKAQPSLEGLDTIEVKVTRNISPENKKKWNILIQGIEPSSLDPGDFILKLRSTKALFHHNSIGNPAHIFFKATGTIGFGYSSMFSEQEQKSIQSAEQKVKSVVKRVSKGQKADLDQLLGKLREKYEVGFTTPDIVSSERMPLIVSLTDRTVEVPLSEWGSGTQNRTHILMSILRAARSKAQPGDDGGNTPLVVIEEPESFLHPGAQAEFGGLLQALSSELGIQIIATTHSPFMLNQVDTASNILLRRKVIRRKISETERVSTSHNDWMEPFAEHLGIIPKEFEGWRKFFGRRYDKVILVEGEIDKEYFEYLCCNYESHFHLPQDVEIVPYNGKDALKNAAMVKFVLSRAGRAVLTFDLDALSELKKPLESIGLCCNIDFFPIGLDEAGKRAIEGLLPDRIVNAVNGREPSLIRRLVSGDDRNSARNQIKKKYLEEMKSVKDLTKSELAALAHTWSTVIARF